MNLTIALVTAAVVILVVGVMLALRARGRRTKPAEPTRPWGDTVQPGEFRSASVTTDAALRDRAAREGREYRPGMYDPADDIVNPFPTAPLYGGWNSGPSGPAAEAHGSDGAASHGAHAGGSLGWTSSGGGDYGGASSGGGSDSGSSAGSDGGGSW